MTDDARHGPDWPGGWPPSNYAILLAIMLLLATALGLAVSSEAVANELATYAYYSLAVAVAIRISEHLVGTRLASGLTDLSTREADTVSRFVPVVEGSNGIGGGDVSAGDEPCTAPSSWLPLKRRIHDVSKYTLVATIGGGLVIALYWTRTPGVSVSSGFLFGWTTVVWLLGSVTIATARD